MKCQSRVKTEGDTGLIDGSKGDCLAQEKEMKSDE
jgi:hypothetical protein